MNERQRPSRLLLCEGPDDAEFFRALIEERNLPAYRVKHNGTKADPTGGNSKFASGLRAHYELDGPFSRVLVVSDNDEDPTKSFNSVRSQVEAYFGFAPNAAGHTLAGPPRLCILMIPWIGVLGNLECLCTDAAKAADKTKASHVDQFSALVGTDKWKSECRRKEMWLRSNLAARSEADPFVSLRNVFSDKKNRGLVPLREATVKRIADFLIDFAR
jgi:hypothetical protein